MQDTPSPRTRGKQPGPSASGYSGRGYLSQDTIAALASAPGGALSVIRVSGPKSFDLLLRLTGARDLSAFEPRKLARARMIDPKSADLLDDALAVRFPNPDSFTGEDVVEFQIHGGAFLSNRLLEILLREGARQALPGEFSFRAVRNGKMTLSQAQAVADLIGASNDDAIRLALEKMSGTQNRLLESIARELRRLAVLGEAGIDFSDQDLDEVSLPRLASQIQPLLETLDRLHSTYDRGVRVQSGVGVAFIGLPNAGKSSFFNSLLGEDRSIVSELAGTTRDIVREHLTLRGKHQSVTLRLEDTAGLRVADHAVEKIGIERSQKAARQADLILFLVDPSQPIAPVLEQWRSLGEPRTKTLGILTKADLSKHEQIAACKKALQATGVSVWKLTSAITGEGISDAIDAIVHECEHFISREKNEVLLTRLDQVKAVEDAIQHLRRAQTAPEIDLFASDLRQALHALGPLMGDTLPDDILGLIFSEFCIGK